MVLATSLGHWPVSLSSVDDAAQISDTEATREFFEFGRLEDRNSLRFEANRGRKVSTCYTSFAVFHYFEPVFRPQNFSNTF